MHVSRRCTATTPHRHSSTKPSTSPDTHLHAEVTEALRGRASSPTPLLGRWWAAVVAHTSNEGNSGRTEPHQTLGEALLSFAHGRAANERPRMCAPARDGVRWRGHTYGSGADALRTFGGSGICSAAPAGAGCGTACGATPDAVIGPLGAGGAR